jgi:hypothetical protein
MAMVVERVCSLSMTRIQNLSSKFFTPELVSLEPVFRQTYTFWHSEYQIQYWVSQIAVKIFISAGAP